MIAKRVTTTARTIRIRAEWNAATLQTEPTLPGDTPVTRFERLMGRLSLLQTQMPARYQTPNMLTEKLLQAIKEDWFEATVITDATAPPHILAARIKLMLATGPPRAATTPTVAKNPATTAPSPTTSSGTAHTLDLPSVHILRHNAVPLLVGLSSHQRLSMIVHTPKLQVIIENTTTNDYRNSSRDGTSWDQAC